MKYLTGALAGVTLLFAVVACGDDGGQVVGGTTCPNSLEGWTPNEVEEAFGRPADETEFDGRYNHTWYFGDDDEVLVQFSGAGQNSRAVSVVWYIDGAIASQLDQECPLPPMSGDHPTGRWAK